MGLGLDEEPRPAHEADGANLDPFLAPVDPVAPIAPVSDELGGLGDDSLLGPGLPIGGGRGFDVAGPLVLDDLDADLANIQHTGDLDDVANKQTKAVDAKVASPTAAVMPKKPLPAMATDRDGMRAQIQGAGDKEIEQLGTALEKQVGDLDRRYGADLDKLDGDIAKQKSSVAGAANVETSLGADVAKRATHHANHAGAGMQKIDKAADAGQKKLTADHTEQKEYVTAMSTSELVAKMRGDAAATAVKIRASAQQEATSARMKPLQAVGAGMARHGAVAPGEQAPIAPAVNKRVNSAVADNDAVAQRILARGEADAIKVVADAEARANALTAHHTGKATSSADQTHATQSGRVSGVQTAANTQLATIAQTAHDQMDAARDTAVAKAASASTDGAAKLDAEKAAAEEKRSQLREEAVRKLQATHDSEVAKVKAKTAKLLADLDGTTDGDLTKVGKKFARELRDLDESDEHANAALKKLVKRSSRSLHDEVESRRKAVRAQAAKAKALIASAVAAAKKEIRSTDRKAERDIAKAARRGLSEVKRTSKDALVEQHAGNAAREAMITEARVGYTEMRKTRTDSNEALHDLALTADKRWGTEGAADATAALDGAKPIEALNVLTSMSPEAQGMAIDQMTATNVTKLIHDLPEGRREELESLIKHTKDKEKKLQLWEAFHRSEVANDVERTKGDIGAPGARTPAQEETFRRHQSRQNIATTSGTEITEEAAFLRAKPDFKAEDVDALMERKATEHDMEMKYNLNITNEVGTRKDGSKIVWTNEELNAMEGSFSQLPVDHMAGNKLLSELRREDIAMYDGKENTWVGGLHGGGVVTVLDNGAYTGGTGYRHGGDRRELASAHTCQKCGVEITQLDMVVTHEIGHDMHDQTHNEAVFEKFQQISGWSDLADKAALKSAGLSNADIKKLEKTRSESWGRNEVHKDGKVYMVDPYSDGYLVVEEAAIPKKGESAVGEAGENDDTWAYARTNYKDHFAEMYAKAVHVPEMLHSDLVERPEATARLAHDKLAREQQALDDLKNAGADPKDIATQQALVDKAKTDDKQATSAEDIRHKQFDLMRNEIFHTDTAEAEAKARLQARGIPPDKLAEFTRRAAIASTPEQIKTIEEEVAAP